MNPFFPPVHAYLSCPRPAPPHLWWHLPNVIKYQEISMGGICKGDLFTFCGKRAVRSLSSSEEGGTVQPRTLNSPCFSPPGVGWRLGLTRALTMRQRASSRPSGPREASSTGRARQPRFTERGRELGRLSGICATRRHGQMGSPLLSRIRLLKLVKLGRRAEFAY